MTKIKERTCMRCSAWILFGSLISGSLLGGCAEDDCEGPVNISIQNKSAVDFSAVMVEFPNKNIVQYGAVAAGGTSAAQSIPEAYRYAYVEATAGGKKYVLQPIDFVGETPLCGGGSFVYALTLQDEQLSIELVTLSE